LQKQQQNNATQPNVLFWQRKLRVLIITLIIKLIIPEQRRLQLNGGGSPKGILVHLSDRAPFIFFSFTVNSTDKITERQRRG
jgi:hypothetical protein